MYHATSMRKGTALFWVITHRVVVSSGNLLPTFRDKLSVQSARVKYPTRSSLLTFEGGTDMLSRNVAINYHYSLCNSPQGCSPHLRCSGSLKSRI